MLNEPNLTFNRVQVDYLVRGNSRIQWELSEHFCGPSPWTFQLQVAESDISGANWTDVGAPVVDAYLTTDPTQRYYGKEQNAFYRVKLTTDDDEVYYSNPQSVTGNLDFKSWGYAQELTRKEILRLELLKVGIEGIFLKAKHAGTAASSSEVDSITGDIIDTISTGNYGRPFEDGYYTAVPLIFGDINPHERYNNRSLQDGQGMVNVQITKGIFVAAPFMSMNDIWINKTSDLRYWIHKISVRTHVRGVPITTDVELRPIPTSDVIYQYPIPAIS